MSATMTMLGLADFERVWASSAEVVSRFAGSEVATEVRVPEFAVSPAGLSMQCGCFSIGAPLESTNGLACGFQRRPDAGSIAEGRTA